LLIEELIQKKVIERVGWELTVPDLLYSRQGLRGIGRIDPDGIKTGRRRSQDQRQRPDRLLQAVVMVVSYDPDPFLSLGKSLENSDSAIPDAGIRKSPQIR
jgi:hypothetical protein